MPEVSADISCYTPTGDTARSTRGDYLRSAVALQIQTCRRGDATSTYSQVSGMHEAGSELCQLPLNQ